MRIIRTHETSPNSIPDAFERDMVYNGLDCAVTLDAFYGMIGQLDEYTGPTYALSRALQGPTLEMRCRGILVDQARKMDVIDEFFNKMEIVEEQLSRIVLDGVGMPSFNWRSPPDLQRLFYEELGLPVQRKSGRPTTDRKAREDLAIYPTAQQIVAHINVLADLGKKISVLRSEIDEDGRIRTSYNIAGTSTGRFSSSFSEFGTGGNLQNIEESLRSILISDPGTKFAKFDAKSGESFCVGAIEWNLFGDGRYLEACESGDPHTAAARECWPNLAWTGDLSLDKDIAEQPFYRHNTYRFLCKKLGHGCLTPDHEVLTREGWVSIAAKPDEIMTWTEAKSEFQSVNNWSDFEYDGILQSFEGNSISLLCTHDHRIPFKKDLRYDLWEAQAEWGPQSKMPLGSGWVGGNEEVSARLIAAFMCDGYLDQYNITFHFKKMRKVNRLLELLSLEGIEHKLYENTDGTYKIALPKLDWPKFPGAFMLNWTEECLRDFIEELRWWDGYIGPTAISISSTKRESLEWYQTFGRLLGIGGQIQKPQTSGFGSTVYRLQQNNRKWAAGSSVHWTKLPVGNRRVLCPTVPASWFYVRRNGKIFVTGNSNYGGQPQTLAEQSQLPISVVTDFQRKYFTRFPAHRQWQESVANSLRRHGYLISLLGRKRYFFGRRNDPATLREAIAFDPQSSLADIVNTAMLNLWRLNIAPIVMHDHDALTFQYPEKDEDWIIPMIQQHLTVPVPLAGGRVLRIPYDAKSGWNKGDYSKDNPAGLKDFKGHDDRRRPKTENILDKIVARKR